MPLTNIIDRANSPKTGAVPTVARIGGAGGRDVPLGLGLPLEELRST